MDTSSNFFVVADANTNTSSTGITLKLSSTVITASNGTEITSATINASAVSKTHAVSQNTAVIAKAANASQLITTSALRFTVAASGKDFVTLNSINLNAQLSGYIGTQVVEVYKNSISAGNLAGTGSVGGDTIDLNIGTNNTVDAGNTVTYIVVVKDALVNSAANSSDWSVSLNDVNMNTDISAAAYYNVGQFPITEVK